MRAWMFVAAMVGMSACGSEEEVDPVNCGEDLTCIDGEEFCLGYGPQGDVVYSCEPFPAGCDNFDDMCDSVCVDDWALEVCPSAVAFGCVSINSNDEAFCED